MRPQPDVPPPPGSVRRARPRGEGRGRVLLLTTLVVLLVLFLSSRAIASFYTDYLWYHSLDLAGVWRGVLGAKLVLSAIFTVVFFLLCWTSLTIADRIAPAFRPAGPEEDLIERYHEIIGDRGWLVRLGISGAFGLLAGANMGAHWNEWILFTHRVPFGQKDATFHTDIGFYVFQLPFLSALLGWLFSSLVVVLLVTIAAHYINGGIRAQSALERVTPQVKVHVSVLLAVLALVKTASYWLARYDLTFSTRGTVDGATYTDANIELKALYLLLAISIFAAALFVANIWRRGWVLPALAVGLWAFVAVLAGEAVPAFVQRFRVEPAESSKEAPYIRRNIAATRQAYGLSDVATKDFRYTGQLDAQDLRQNTSTVRNIRLWDASIIKDSYEALQSIKDFYRINDVDIDRYPIDGELTEVMISGRDLKTSGVAQDSWEAKHLTYTHGYGVVLSPANAKEANGQPSLQLKDVPQTSAPGTPKVTQPAIYFGEKQSGYVIVNTDRPEIDYQVQSKTKFKAYAGKDGIEVGSGAKGFLRKAAFALRFGDINPLISGNIKGDSRVLINRDVSTRVKAVAPFLSFDHDPYLVLIDGRIQYVVDGYTTTSRYPNAQRADTSGLDPASGLSGKRFNYVRNSVKAVVDAYDGTVKLYVTDSKDPILKAYRKAFPELFTPVANAPQELRDHFRYPEDLFTVQTQMWARYHVGDPDTFYNGTDAWNVAREPGINQVAAGRNAAATGAVDANGNPITQDDRFEPQYLLMKLPGESKESFMILRPFVPVSSGSEGDVKLLTSFMIAKADPGDYGKLETYVMPSSQQVNGPSIAAEQMKSNPDVGELQTLLCQQGSKCELRNLVLVPVNNALLYVRSFYVRGDNGGTPELARVIVYQQSNSGTNRIAVSSTLQGALEKLYGPDVPQTLEDTGNGAGNANNPAEGGNGSNGNGSGNGSNGNGTGTGTVEADERVNQLIEQIVQAFDAADAAAKKGDQVGYAQNIEKAQKLSTELQKAYAAAAKAPSSTKTEGSAKGTSGTEGTTTTTAPKSSTTNRTTTTAPGTGL